MSDFEGCGDALKDIPALIRWRGDGLSFVELLHYLPHLAGAYGVYAGPEGFPLVWDGVSEECIHALNELQANRTIILRPSGTFTYLADGCQIRLPEATRIRAYKRPRWLPVCLHLVRRNGDAIWAGSFPALHRSNVAARGGYGRHL